jgi:hypothetical protein
MNTINKTVKTKINATDKEATQTSLTLDFSNVSTEQLQELAARSAVIAWQARCRAEGIIPEGDTFDVAECFVKQPRKAPSLEAMISKLSPEERAKLLAKYA